MRGSINIWRVLLLRGILSIGAGVALLVWPHVALNVLTVLFGAYAMADGGVAFWMGLHSNENKDHMRSLLSEGALGILFGAVAITHPHLVITLLIYLIAAWALLTGLIEHFDTRELSLDAPEDWCAVLIGIVSLICGALLLAFPHQGMHVLVWLISAYACTCGCLYTIRALRIHRRHTRPSLKVLGQNP